MIIDQRSWMLVIRVLMLWMSGSLSMLEDRSSWPAGPPWCWGSPAACCRECSPGVRREWCQVSETTLELTSLIGVRNILIQFSTIYEQETWSLTLASVLRVCWRRQDTMVLTPSYQDWRVCPGPVYCHVSDNKTVSGDQITLFRWWETTDQERCGWCVDR